MLCIDPSKICNGVKDCSDQSDELNCKTRLPMILAGTCSKDEFQCDDSICIPMTFKCDGTNDCIDGSDEKDCHDVTVTCQPDEVQCHTDKKCIPKIYLCDQDQDCMDGSDERNCPIGKYFF